MPFRRAHFKGTEVLARCDEQGRLVSEGGRVEIRYRPSDARAYHAALRNLTLGPDAAIVPDSAMAAAAAAPSARPEAGARRSGIAPAPAPDGAIVAYADGACSGNPGPAGVGIVLIDGRTRRELSRYLGRATNNIAELTAIELALDAIAARERPVRIYTDSQYAIGVVSKGWKAKANQELVARLRAKLREFSDLEFHYVRGHSGVALNERADALAVEAVERQTDGEWVVVLS